MATRRTLRVARSIKEAVSRILIQELNDPRMEFVTVTEVDVSPDLKAATVKLSVMGDDKQCRRCLKAIEHAHGWIQSEVSSKMSMRTVPRLAFELDDSVKRSVEISQLISRAVAEDRQAQIDRGERPADDSDPTPEETGE